MRSLRPAGGLLAVSLLLLGACAATPRLDSARLDPPASSDRGLSAARDRLAPLEDCPLSVGVANDDSILYLVLATGNRDLQAQILRQGLIIWFDPTGGKARTFGAQYPLGTMADALEDGALTRRRQPEGGEQDEAARRQRLAEAAEAVRGRMRIHFTGEGDAWSLAVAECRGVSVSYRVEASRLVVEMAIPLWTGPGRPYAVGAGAGGTLALGFQTPELDREARREAMGGRGGGRGVPPGGGTGGPPGGGRGGPPGGMSRPDPLDWWIIVTLAPAAP
ncbi:MAG: hypothetical protein JW819_07270 [Candidatus Krumholzibacteriota bacterium]|nr:hypothetical protein [Candidatus Krumholzibacteriota bacterium]